MLETLSDLFSDPIGKGWQNLVALGAWLWSCLTDNSAAGWAQAIGSIAAVLVAVYVPWAIAKKQLASQNRETALKARALAITILPEILSVRVRAPHVRKYCAEGDFITNEKYRTLESTQEPLDDRLKKLIIPLSAEIIRAMERMHVLPDPALTHTLLLLSRVQHYNATIEGYREANKGIQKRTHMLAVLDDIVAVSEAAVDALEKLQEPIQ